MLNCQSQVQVYRQLLAEGKCLKIKKITLIVSTSKRSGAKTLYEQQIS